MSYSPNQSQVYLTAFAGTLAGILGSTRSQNDLVPARYNPSAQLAHAFAVAVDQAWTGSSPNQMDLWLLQSICEASWAGKHVPPSTDIYLVPATYSTLAIALVAATKQGDVFLSGQGIVPSPSGAALGGFTLVNTSNSPFQAVNGTHALMDASGVSQLILKTPLNPMDGMVFSIKDWKGNSTINPLVLSPQGAGVKIEDPRNPGSFLSTSVSYAFQGGVAQYKFYGPTTSWVKIG